MNYDAFGNEENPAANDTNPWKYSGEYFDYETENYYLRARYYNPSTGRFTQEDPIRDGLNWYAYCAGNPIMFTDPSGKYKEGDEDLPEVIQILINGENKDGSGGLSLAWQKASTDKERETIAETAQKLREYFGDGIKINRHMILLNRGGASRAGHTATLLIDENDVGVLLSYYSSDGNAISDGQMRLGVLNKEEWGGLLYRKNI